MSVAQWKSRVSALKAACQRIGAGGRFSGEPPRFEIAPPAIRTEVEAIESDLGLELPMSFRKVLLGFSSRVCISWQLPQEKRPPKPFQIFSGECSWDLEKLPDLQSEYREWLFTCFDNPDDEYDAIWHEKLPFMEVGNGDYIAIDIASPESEAVVYLSHDDGEGHGYKLGETFADYVDRLTKLGCVGPEDWQWLPFTTNAESLLLPDCENAQIWRRWMGLDEIA